MADTTVELQVTSTNPNDDTWFQCRNSNNDAMNYWYQFSGGNMNDPNKPGGIKFASGGGAKQVDIKLKSSNGFKISNVGFIYYLAGGEQPPADITIPAEQKSDNKWTINDSNVDAEKGYFSVTVSTTGDNPVGMICDPFWEND